MLDGEGKVRSFLALQPKGGDYEALVDFFRRNDILGLAVREAGCWAAELQVPVVRSGPVVVTALWDSAEAYEGWRSHPVRATFSSELERLTEANGPPMASSVYTVEIAARRTLKEP